MRKALREQQNKSKSKRSKKTQSKKIDFKKMKEKLVLDNKSKAMVAAISMLIIVVVAIMNYTTLGLVINKNITTKDVTSIELSAPTSKIIAYGDSVLICNTKTIECYTKSGNVAWTINLSDMVNAEVYSSGKYIQIVNKDKNIVYVYKNKYEVARIKVEGQIYSTNINSDGISIIEYSTAGNKTALGVYDNNGVMRYNIKLGNKTIGKYIVSDNMKYLAYIDVNISGISAYTSIKLINFNKISDENNGAETIHTIEGALAYDIYFSGKKLIVCQEDSYVVYSLNYKNKKIYKISQSSIENTVQYGDRCAYVTIDSEGNSLLNIKKMKKEEPKSVKIEGVPKYFIYDNSIIYLAYQNKIFAYNKFGMKIKEYDSDTVVTKPVVFNKGRSVAMTISNKLIMFTI